MAVSIKRYGFVSSGREGIFYLIDNEAPGCGWCDKGSNMDEKGATISVDEMLSRLTGAFAQSNGHVMAVYYDSSVSIDDITLTKEMVDFIRNAKV